MLYTPIVAKDAIPPRNYPPPLSLGVLGRQVAGSIVLVLFLNVAIVAVDHYVPSSKVLTDTTIWLWAFLAVAGYLFVSGVTLRRSVPWYSRYGNALELCKLVVLVPALPSVLEFWTKWMISGKEDEIIACSHQPSEWIFQAAFLLGLHFSFVDAVDIFQQYRTIFGELACERGVLG